METIIGIYKITSPSNKIYIGQSVNIVKRIRQYKYLRCTGQVYLHRSLLKYGWDAHRLEIIERFDCNISKQTLNRQEIFHWQKFINDGFEMLNMREPGSSGRLSEDAKEKLRKRATGRRHSIETKIKISLIGRGRKFTDEHKRKLSEGHLGKDYNKSFLGKKHTEETKRKMSAAQTGKKFSKQHCENIRIAQIGIHTKPVFQFDINNNFIKRWGSMKEAGLSLGISGGNISLCANGKIRRTGKYRWRFAA